MKNYFKLTSETKVNIFGVTLYRLELTIDCKWGKKGEKGGWVESENLKNGNARVSGDAWVSGDAQVYGDARVYGNAQVYGNARVSGNAQVYGNARVSGDAWVSGNARVSGDAQVYGDAWEKSPFQIQGTMHFVTECKIGFLQIGCSCKTLKEWLKEYKGVGKSHGFTSEQIKEYGIYIKMAISISKLKLNKNPKK